MPTDLVWFAVGLGDKLNQALVPWKCPIKWGSKNREWIFDKDFTIRKYLWWYVVVYGLVFSWVCGGYLYLLYGKFRLNKSDLSILILFEYGILAMMNTMVTSQVTLYTILGKEGITLQNAFIRYHERVRLNAKLAEVPGRIKKKRKIPKNWLNKAIKSLGFELQIPSWKKDDGKLDYIGICLLFYMSPVQLWIPFCGSVLIVLIWGIDIHKYLLKDVWPLLGYKVNSLWMILLDGLLRFGMTAAVTMEMCRTVPNLVHFLVIPAQLIIESINILLAQSKKASLKPGDVFQGMDYLTQLHILYEDTATVLATTIFLLMTFGIVLGSLLNFCCIRFHSVGLAAWNYAIFVGGAGIVYFFIMTLLPVAIGFHEKSSETIVNWKRNLVEGGVVGSKGARVQLQRKLWSMRPLTQKAGLFGVTLYTIDKGRMGIFLSSIVDNTTTLLLSFDLEGVTTFF